MQFNALGPNNNGILFSESAHGELHPVFEEDKSNEYIHDQEDGGSSLNMVQGRSTPNLNRVGTREHDSIDRLQRQISNGTASSNSSKDGKNLKVAMASTSQFFQQSQGAFNIKAYNNTRMLHLNNVKRIKQQLDALNGVPLQIKSQPQQPVSGNLAAVNPSGSLLKIEEEQQNEGGNSHQNSTQMLMENSVVKEIKGNCFGNLPISIFWEEKIIMIIRFTQFYGYLMMVMYEVFPYTFRDIWGHPFFFLSGSIHYMLGQDYYYAVIQNLVYVMANLAAYVGFILLVALVSLTLLCSKKLNFRLLKLKKHIFFFKWTAWFIELIYFPVILNIVEFGTCNYTSQKQAIEVVNCQALLPNGYIVMMVISLAALVIGLCYNILLAVHLYNEKISNMLNEEYVQKKEVEFIVGISEMWLTRHFYMFSSFRSELFKMYHRPIFNTLTLLLCLVHGLMSQGLAKVGIILAIFAVMAIYTFGARPYRCQFSNILLFVLAIIMVANCFVLLLKMSGFRSAIFVDTYFYNVLILLNAFGWFLVFAFILFAIVIKQGWPLNRDLAQKAILGQELAIVYIKRARTFRRQVVKSKVYGELEKKEMAFILEQLTEQFNYLRDKEALVMDALLEVLDQLKEMKRNYEENPYLYNFNFKEELKGLVHSRYRIYETKEI